MIKQPHRQHIKINILDQLADIQIIQEEIK